MPLQQSCTYVLRLSECSLRPLLQSALRACPAENGAAHLPLTMGKCVSTQSPLPEVIDSSGSFVYLQEADLPTCCYHGDVPLDGRKEAIAQFAAGDSGEGEQPVMVCTDLAAR